MVVLLYKGAEYYRAQREDTTGWPYTFPLAPEKHWQQAYKGMMEPQKAFLVPV